MRGDHDEALRLLAEAIERNEAWAAQAPNDVERVAELVSLRSSLARVQRMKGDLDGALRSFEAAGAVALDGGSRRPRRR